jgi:hypothetical protein
MCADYTDLDKADLDFCLEAKNKRDRYPGTGYPK